MSMFCYQCEQTAKGTGCTVQGVCGKEPQTAALQDLLIYAVKDISRYAHRAGQFGARDRDIDVFTVESLFSTLTNVNFDTERFQQLLKEAAKMREKARKLYENAAKKAGQAPQILGTAVTWWERTDDIDDLVRKGQAVSVKSRIDEFGQDVAGLQELITYGLKGAAAYLDHAQILGKEDNEVYTLFYEMLNFLSEQPTDTGELLQRAGK